MSQYTNKNDIHQWLYEHRIMNYTIHDDLSVSVHGNAMFNRKGLSAFPFQFRDVQGVFSIEGCSFTTLKNVGVPQHCQLFNCTHNLLDSLEGCPNAKDIFASYNKIRTLAYIPFSCVKLEVYNNNIENFSGIPKNVQLKELSISFNPLNSLEGMPDSITFLRAEHCKLNTTKNISSSIDMLHVDYNQITELVDLPPRMTLLNIDHNQLSHFQDAPRVIEHFFCGSNPVSTFEGFPLVVMNLNAACSNITDKDLQFINLKELNYLYLRYNPLTSLDLPEELEELHISETQIQQIKGLKRINNTLMITVDKPEDLLVLKGIDFFNCTGVVTHAPLGECFKTYSYDEVQKIIQMLDLKEHLEQKTIGNKIEKQKNKI